MLSNGGPSVEMQVLLLHERPGCLTGPVLVQALELVALHVVQCVLPFSLLCPYSWLEAMAAIVSPFALGREGPHEGTYPPFFGVPFGA